MRPGGLRSRALGAERMDEPDQDAAELTRSLADLRGVNRWLGGTRQVLGLVGRMVERTPDRPVRLLDVGTGSADLPLVLAAWAHRRKIDLRIVATDLHPHTVAVARRRTEGEPRISVQAADALALPFDDGAFHLAMCNTALHHFDRGGAIQVLRELSRVSARGLVVTDLRRSFAGLQGARLLAATVWRGHPVTRYDAPLSVRRAFTVDELREVAVEAGLHRPVVRADPLFRLSLVADREASR